jgi:hypothetical protein
LCCAAAGSILCPAPVAGYAGALRISKDPKDYAYAPPPGRTRRAGQVLRIALLVAYGALTGGLVVGVAADGRLLNVVVTAAAFGLIWLAMHQVIPSRSARGGGHARYLVRWAVPVLAVASVTGAGVSLALGGSDPLFAGVLFGAWSVGLLRQEPGPETDDGTRRPESRLWPSRDPADYR